MIYLVIGVVILLFICCYIRSYINRISAHHAVVAPDQDEGPIQHDQNPMISHYRETETIVDIRQGYNTMLPPRPLTIISLE